MSCVDQLYKQFCCRVQLWSAHAGSGIVVVGAVGVLTSDLLWTITSYVSDHHQWYFHMDTTGVTSFVMTLVMRIHRKSQKIFIYVFMKIIFNRKQMWEPSKEAITNSSSYHCSCEWRPYDAKNRQIDTISGMKRHETHFHTTCNVFVVSKVKTNQDKAFIYWAK